MPTPVTPSAALVTLLIEAHKVPKDTTPANVTARLIRLHLVPKNTTDATVTIELKKAHHLPIHARSRLSDAEWKSDVRI